ncbi:hypothetical protein ACYATM_06325 [Lactobacillaceae bacterium Scapto_B20]
MHFSNLVELPLDSTNGIMKESWPPFMVPNKQSLKNWNQVRNAFPILQICLCDKDRVVGVVNSLPLNWNGDSESVPEHWDDILTSGLNQTIQDANTLSAINLSVDVD